MGLLVVGHDLRDVAKFRSRATRLRWLPRLRRRSKSIELPRNGVGEQLCGRSFSAFNLCRSAHSRLQQPLVAQHLFNIADSVLSEIEAAGDDPVSYARFYDIANGCIVITIGLRRLWSCRSVMMLATFPSKSSTKAGWLTPARRAAQTK